MISPDVLLAIVNDMCPPRRAVDYVGSCLLSVDLSVNGIGTYPFKISIFGQLVEAD